ncbi:hypothetical protein ACT7DA_16730 [Bacillus pacificus]
MNSFTEKKRLLLFKEQSEVTELPFIFLSAGVSAKLFQETLKFAKESGSTFNGVLCGRATWKDGVAPFAISGEQAGRDWLKDTGKRNAEELNLVLKETANSWFAKVKQTAELQS